MRLSDKISLTWKSSKVIYVISLLITLSSALFAVFLPDFVSGLLALKVFSIPVILYLYISLSKGERLYFYINLGLSRREIYGIPLVLDAVLFVVLITIILIISYVL